MKFHALYSATFVDIVSVVYKLRHLEYLYPSQSQFPILASRNGFKSSNAFNLPLGFYQTAELVNSMLSSDEWGELCDKSRNAGINVCVSSLGELNYGNGIHVANNPVLEMSALHNPFDLYSKNHRQNIRKERNKANNYAVTVAFSESPEDLLKFYDLMAFQYVKEHKMVFQPFLLFSKLLASGLGKLIIAKHEDDVVGGMLCIIDGDVFHYNWGVRKKFLNLNVGTLLVDYAVTYAHSSGYRYFDFGSTPVSDDHLYEFKMKWGCKNFRVYKYFTLKKISQIDLNSSFRFLRNVYSKTPPRYAKKLMPIIVPWLVT